MIPLSVRMTGWMRYRDETVADFSAGTLIAICGENGAGKSSIFDAITFALYGQHRLGKQRAEQLISEGRDRLSVEFEFEAEGRRYLVRRSRGKKAGERDQSLWVGEAGGEWAQVPGTEKEDALERAIASIVRLSHGAFTASFLLQQGEATAFVDADPKPRFEIISSLIGLKEYERLEKAAREAAKSEKDYIDRQSEKLEDLGDSDEAAIETLRAEVGEVAARERAAAAAAQRAKDMLADAQRWERLAGEIAALDEKIAGAEALLERREEIERNATNFEKLSAAYDRTLQIQAAMSDASRGEAVASEAMREADAIDVDGLAAVLTAAAKTAKAAIQASRSAEVAHAEAAEQERLAYDFLQVATAVLDGRARVASLVEETKRIDAQLKELSKTGKAIDVEGAAAAAEDAERALEVARAEGAASRAKVEQLSEELAARKAAAKEAQCARCGQRIDKAAAKQQIEELTAQLKDAQKGATAATAAENSAGKARTSARKAAEEAASAANKQAQQASKLEGRRAVAVEEGQRASDALGAQESKLDGRLKDVESGERLHGGARDTLDDASAALDGARIAAEEARQAEEEARASLEEGRTRRADLEMTSREQAALAAGHRKQAEAYASGLGEIGERALADPAEVLDALRRSREELATAPEEQSALERAAKEHASAEGERRAKRAEVEGIPEAHHVGVDAAAAAEGEASRAAIEVGEEHRAAADRLSRAEASAAAVKALREEVDAARVKHQRLRKLTALLGKKGLQGVLVSGALTTITNHANAFLDRLTGGSLQLTLERDGDALELRAIDMTCMRDARSAKALSGSQKFRCAVAIASGIGQYAGAGGMRSIVIDEGFGSLDVQSQQTMVEELKQLAQHMDKVIVVSHLEAFTEPANFPDRLVVSRTADGGSTITRAG